MSYSPESPSVRIVAAALLAVSAGACFGVALSFTQTSLYTTVTVRPAIYSQVAAVNVRAHNQARYLFSEKQSEELMEVEAPISQSDHSSSLKPTSVLALLAAFIAAGWVAIRSKVQKVDDLEAKWCIASTSGDGTGKHIRIATRKSPLAMWQAEFIQSELERLWPGVNVELQPMSTKGDKILDSPLAKVGGKGLFVKELETALLERRSDIAVHSTKDVPMELPEGLVLGIICKRHDPCDAIVFPKGSKLTCLDDLPIGARVGTSSLRRQCQLLLKRPDLKFLELRGNVNTRLAKLDSGDYDAIILAAAGLKRLGFSDRVLPGETNIIDPNVMLPAAGQGALSIELRTDDPEMMRMLMPLHHIPDAITVCCERAMNRRLSGGCQVPISGFAQLKDGQLRMEARVGSVSGKGPLIIKHKTIAFPMDGEWPALQHRAETLGIEVADMLLADGAQAYLDEAYDKQDVGVMSK